MKKQIFISGFLALTSLGFAQNTFPYPATGNIGIGTTTPAQQLHVTNNIQADGTVMWGSGLVRTETRNDAGLQGNAGAKSGYFETAAPSPAANWPSGANSWWHLLDVRHSNNTNNYAMQISGSFFDQDIYFRKTNNLATTAWSKIVANNGGKVGINTAVNVIPSGYLHVKNAVVNNNIPTLLIENTSQGIYQDIKAQVNKVMKAENKGFVIENTMSNAGEVFKIYGEGRTLIGLAGISEVPTAMLQIKSPIARESFRIYNNTETANYLSLWHAGSGGSAIDPIGSGKLYLGYDQQTDIYIGGNTASGNNASRLGIGTNALAAYLHIKTPASAGSGHGLLVEHNDPNGNYASEVRVKNANTSALVITNATSGLVETFRVYGSGRTIVGNTLSGGNLDANAKLAVDNKVQIGGALPTNHTHYSDYLLSVKGKGVFKEVIVTNQNWADFVFANDYKLASLKDVEAFYKANKHLPEIPTAKEVEENGVSVGEMNKLLLQKIEELTIYVVEQQKQIDALKEKSK